MTIREAIEKHFKEAMIYFHQSDAHKMIEGDTYLRYQIKHDNVLIWFGGDNGEVCLLVSNDGDKIDSLINLLTR